MFTAIRLLASLHVKTLGTARNLVWQYSVINFMGCWYIKCRQLWSLLNLPLCLLHYVTSFHLFLWVCTCTLTHIILEGYTLCIHTCVLSMWISSSWKWSFHNLGSSIGWILLTYKWTALCEVIYKLCVQQNENKLALNVSLSLWVVEFLILPNTGGVMQIMLVVWVAPISATDSKNAYSRNTVEQRNCHGWDF